MQWGRYLSCFCMVLLFCKIVDCDGRALDQNRVPAKPTLASRLSRSLVIGRGPLRQRSFQSGRLAPATSMREADPEVTSDDESLQMTLLAVAKSMGVSDRKVPGVSLIMRADDVQML